MRIKLKKGAQKKLILMAKGKMNCTWKKLGQILGTTEGYLRGDLFNEKILLSREMYKKLCDLLKENYDRYILVKLEDSWGRSKGGKNSAKDPKLLIKKKSKELAELIGIILGDGNIWCRKGSHYYLTICGDSEKDKDYLLNYVKPLFEKLFNKQMCFRKHKKNKEIFIYIGSKDVIYTLEKFGLKSGNKKKNNLGIPEWIFESEDFLKACIRGLVDTDGSVCPITGRDYPYIWFSSNIDNLRKTFDLAMKKLGFKISKWNIRKDRTPDTYIGSKKLIEKYIKTISFKNQRHLSKLTLP